MRVIRSKHGPSHLFAFSGALTEEAKDGLEALSHELPPGPFVFDVGAISRINSDYDRQARLAQEIAREHFDARVVLPALLETAMR